MQLFYHADGMNWVHLGTDSMWVLRLTVLCVWNSETASDGQTRRI